MGNLRDTALLAQLNIGMLSARKFDKKETAELSAKHGTKDGVLRLSKKLYTSSEAYKAIAAAGSHGRAVWNRNTLPWDDDGRRIMTAANFMQATQEIRKCERGFWNAVDPFIEQFPFLKAHDKNILNGLFREEDYPTDAKLKKKFYFKTEFEPIPNAEDFRCDIKAEELASIKKQTEASTKAKLARSMEEPYRRLFDGVAHMASRLSGAKSCGCRACGNRTFQSDQFADSLVDNLVDLCEVLPRLVVLPDDNLTRLIEEAKTALTGFSADSIRDNPTVRKTLAERADQLQSELGYMFTAAA